MISIKALDIKVKSLDIEDILNSFNEEELIDTIKNLQDKLQEITDDLNSFNEVKLMKVIKYLKEINDHLNSFKQRKELILNFEKERVPESLTKEERKEIQANSVALQNIFYFMISRIKYIRGELNELSSIEGVEEELKFMDEKIEECREKVEDNYISYLIMLDDHLKMLNSRMSK